MGKFIDFEKTQARFFEYRNFKGRSYEVGLSMHGQCVNAPDIL